MLTARQARILDFVVREYVHYAEPVSSSMVCERGDLEVSPATVRSEMQTLENLGYLSQPHTSAGRIPTDKGYRLFVNNLLEGESYDIPLRDKRKIQSALQESAPDPRSMSHSLARVLSPLSESVVIASIFGEEDFYKTGLAGMLAFPEFRELERMMHFTSFFDEFDRVFAQMHEEFFADIDRYGVNIFIGRENPVRSVRDETVLVVKYRLPERATGSLTVIGPTRMNYRRNIGLLSYILELMEGRYTQR